MKRFFKIRDQLPSTAEEREAHLEALNNIQDDQRHLRHFDFLYENLSILDSKADSLLTFNSIILAVVAIFQSSAQDLSYTITYGLCIVVLLISCILCLSIVWIHWSSTDDLRNVKAHCNMLFKVRESRTIKYRIAWWLSLVCLVAFLVIKTSEIAFSGQ